MPRRFPKRRSNTTPTVMATVSVVFASDGDGTGQRGGAGRGLHGDRHRVVDEQRDGGDLRHLGAEVVARHHVGPAGLRVQLDHLEVRQGHEEEDAEDGQRDGHDQGEGGQPDVGHHLGQHLLGAVGRGRDAVRCQHPERHRPAQPFGGQLLGDQWRSEQLVLQPVAAALGNALRRRPARAAGRRVARSPGTPGCPERSATPGEPSVDRP